jgi:hypothetical protein
VFILQYISLLISSLLFTQLNSIQFQSIPMEEFKQYLALVDAVVSGQSATHVRREAEAQISSIHNNREMWQHLLHFLSFAIEVEVGMNTGSNDNVLFFIGKDVCMCVCIVCVCV